MFLHAVKHLIINEVCDTSDERKIKALRPNPNGLTQG
ncbi:MAG: hypothetical protein ACJAW3_000974 [Lentimonas sp.]|jgi:hypothetical protein